MKQYEVEYRNTPVSAPKYRLVNALNGPAAISGSQAMFKAEGFAVVVTAARKWADWPDEHLPTVRHCG